jgi:copper chaperone CopZ
MVALRCKNKFMTHTYNITGMTCGNCLAKAKSQLLMLGDVAEADVQLTAPQATITMQKHIPVTTLQEALNKAGNYTITEADGGMHHEVPTEEAISWLETYKPILLIGAYITGATWIIEAARNDFNWHNWMQNFMAGFFLVFSFFKLLNLKGFAESYSSYDIIAKKWPGWGYVYAFIELGLGIAYVADFNPIVTNAASLLIMSIGIVGVLQSVLNKRKIQCACLGAVFNLPMSTITIIEDALMIAMSSAMLVSII